MLTRMARMLTHMLTRMTRWLAYYTHSINFTYNICMLQVKIKFLLKLF